MTIYFEDFSLIKNKRIELSFRIGTGLIFLCMVCSAAYGYWSDPYYFHLMKCLFVIPFIPMAYFALFGGELALWLTLAFPLFFYCLMGAWNFLRVHADM